MSFQAYHFKHGEQIMHQIKQRDQPSSLSHWSTYRNQLVPVEEDDERQHYHLRSRSRQASRLLTIKAHGQSSIPKNSSKCVNPIFISLVLIIYILSNQSITTMMSASRKPMRESSSSAPIALASASPAPEPAPASSRSATSVSHRVPPINGSMFGKRSVGGQQAEKKASRKSENSVDHMGTSEPIKYNDIITELIEDFLARNEENVPEEAATAFCRMIVYECNQLLTKRRSLHRKPTSLPQRARR